MNVCIKGKRGEREASHYINGLFPGLDMCRGAQRAGGPDAPDIKGFPGVHWEVKRAERLNIHAAMKQAIRDSEGKAVPVVLHRRNRGPWLVTLEGDNLIAFAKAVILANEAGLASNAGQQAGKAAERVESKPSAECNNVAIPEWMMADAARYGKEYRDWVDAVLIGVGIKPNAIAAHAATQECPSSGKSVSGYGSDGEKLESRNVKHGKGWTAEAIDRDIQSFKELDAMDTDKQTMPTEPIDEQEKMP